ncbi:MAG TPA: translation initiation factor IF-2 [Candidatus Paceibacterota bacterium]|nr:translation initiation factor IF-2 [Candidatus Paceibacterota bacterium]
MSLAPMNARPAQPTPRPPIVVVMGHIDHGKSTLLDYIRKSNVVAGEAGGITQHLSAYEVLHPGEDGAARRITFLDTPGHAAFQAMRERGARVADVAILVVSAEDGVKPQTLEALRAIKDANIPYVVAINKIDKPGANVEKTKQNLAEQEIYIEGYGGDVPWAAISAKTGEGVPALLDLILLTADLAGLTCDLSLPAEGIVAESHMDKRRGVTATLILTNGTLEKGTFLAAGESVTPVRGIEDFKGESVEKATPSLPIVITGWSSVPAVGLRVASFKSKKEAEAFAAEERAKSVRGRAPSESYTAETAVIPVVIKTDVLGSAEAVAHELKKLETETVKVKILQQSVGTITENDVKLGSGTPGAVIIGFNVDVDTRARELAERLNIVIVSYDIIYALAEWFATIVLERTPKVTTEETTGVLRVLKVFSQNKDRQVIGGRVESGVLHSREEFRIMRRDALVGGGTIEELQQQKVKVSEVTEGECGLLVEAKISIVAGDKLECFRFVTK